MEKSKQMCLVCCHPSSLVDLKPMYGEDSTSASNFNALTEMKVRRRKCESSKNQTKVSSFSSQLDPLLNPMVCKRCDMQLIASVQTKIACMSSLEVTTKTKEAAVVEEPRFIKIVLSPLKDICAMETSMTPPKPDKAAKERQRKEIKRKETAERLAAAKNKTKPTAGTVASRTRRNTRKKILVNSITFLNNFALSFRSGESTKERKSIICWAQNLLQLDCAVSSSWHPKN